VSAVPDNRQRRKKFIRSFVAVIWVPDTNLLDVEFSGPEKADQILKSIKDFVPEQWGLPPYDP
jgi:pseudouridine 5'-phosphatase